MDRLSVAKGAALLRQPTENAVIELCGGGGEFTVHGGEALMAVTGAAAVIALDERTMPHQCSFIVKENQRLSIRLLPGSVYSYLHVFGGFDVPKVMGSRSTHIRAGFGGYCGRYLMADDNIAIAASDVHPDCTLLPETVENKRQDIRIVWGAQAHLFSNDVRSRFLTTEFTVSNVRDRMGIRLECRYSDGFPVSGGLSGISDAVIAGDIQIGGDSMATVLLADRQPTGGYPRIATVITADLDRLAQLPSMSVFRFSPVSIEEAVCALEDYRRHIAAIPEKLQSVFCDPKYVDNLLGYNLIDGVVDAKRN